MTTPTVLTAALACLVGCAAATPDVAPTDEPASAPRATASRFAGELVPLNGSLVSGTVRAALDGRSLSVVLEVEGLEAQQLHPQHLHGFFGDSRSAACPTVEADADGDQVLSAGEAEAVTGPPLLPLEPFPLPSDERPLRYEASHPVDPASVGPLSFRVVVIHGVTLDGAYQRGLPVACAELQPVQGMTPPRDGAGA